MSGLREAKCEGALINQFLRSGTSIGANVREAFYAQGMVRNGVLRADRAHLFCGDDFLGSYNWMS